MLEKSEEYGKPVFGSEIEQVINGCVASEGIEYTELGRQTGRMAARVLRGYDLNVVPGDALAQKSSSTYVVLPTTSTSTAFPLPKTLLLPYSNMRIARCLRICPKSLRLF